MKIKSIAVFCGAHLGNDPIYEEKAKEISQLIASKGINVVFGGGDVGLMKVVADTAIEFGGEVTGITCLLYTSPSPRDRQKSRMPSSA